MTSILKREAPKRIPPSRLVLPLPSAGRNASLEAIIQKTRVRLTERGLPDHVPQLTQPGYLPGFIQRTGRIADPPHIVDDT